MVICIFFQGGVVLLFLTLCLNVGYNSAAKKLSVDVGGAKRLHALSSMIQAMILGPWAYIVSSTSDSQVMSFLLVCFEEKVKLLWSLDRRHYYLVLMICKFLPMQLWLLQQINIPWFHFPKEQSDQALYCWLTKF